LTVEETSGLEISVVPERNCETYEMALLESVLLLSCPAAALHTNRNTDNEMQQVMSQDE